MAAGDQSDIEDWLRVHEETAPDWLEVARSTARHLLETRAVIHIDHVREACPPPPPDKDSRVYGAVFKHPDFEGTGQYVKSSRETCHKRPIQLFRRAAA